jgi:hypothetical protein
MFWYGSHKNYVFKHLPLDAELFYTLAEAQVISERWRR